MTEISPASAGRRALLPSLALAFALSAGSASAGIIDPIGDLLATYSGAVGGDLDVTAAGVTLIGDTVRFSTTVNAAIGTTPGVLYVWGIDRGAGTARFVGGAPSVGAGVLFDSVLILRQDGTAQFNDLLDATNSVAIASGISISADTIVATLPASRLVAHGFALDAYGYNIWPRLGTGANNQISDFAPDATTFLADRADASDVAVPATLPLIAASLAGLAGIRRRRTA